MSNLTYDDFMHLAIKNYNRGGDSYFECWNEKTFNEYGSITEADAIEMFRQNLGIEKDRMGW